MKESLKRKAEPEVISEIFKEIQRRSPLIHMIPNTVSAPLCADGLSALGARPLMAVSPEEMKEITAQSDASVINLGQLNLEKQSAAELILRQIAKTGKPLVLDPVGCGASVFRLKAVRKLLSLPWQGMVKGNRSEIYSIQKNRLTSEGIDAVADWELSEQIPKGRVYLVTGEPDRILWQNGHTELFHENPAEHQGKSRYNIVGSGCLAGAVAGACYSVTYRQALESSGKRESSCIPQPDRKLERACTPESDRKLENACILAAVAASLGMAFALEQTREASGYGTAKVSLLDGLSRLPENVFLEWLIKRA